MPFFTKKTAFCVFKGSALENPTKGFAFGNRKPLKRLDLNFMFLNLQSGE